MPEEQKNTRRDSQKNNSVQYVTVDKLQSGRRIDNFLMLRLKGLPRTRIYQMLRKGEVRLNGSRVKQNQKLKEGDTVRIPPVHLPVRANNTRVSDSLVTLIKAACKFEDENLILVDKPAGVVVHSGSGQKSGVIEALRQGRAEHEYLELSHRLDRDTSGCLLIAKQPNILRAIQKAMKNGATRKIYQAFVKGQPDWQSRLVNEALEKGSLAGGERFVRVSEQGKQAATEFTQIKRYRHGSLIEARLLTGRTHQIRVHASHIKHPLAMDRKYGDRDYNKHIRTFGLKRMFLHAKQLQLELEGKSYEFDLPLADDLLAFLNNQNT